MKVPFEILAVALTLLGLASCAKTASAPRQATTAPPSASQTPTRPTASLQPATRGAFSTNGYRNVFVELGFSNDAVQQKVTDSYQQLFHGNPEQQSVMFAADRNEQGPMAYIIDVANADVRSEGMSYGMMIAVQLDQKADFDALWNWAKTYMYHSDVTHPAYGYFAWQMRVDGTAIDDMPAPDGEEYFVTALLFAAHRWGAGEGIYDYAKEAAALLDQLKNRKPITGTVNGKREVTGVSLFNTEQKMVRFTPDSGNFKQNTDHTDPSYHLPAFYELWALWGPEPDRPFWAEAAQVSRDFFHKTTHPKTALSPDYAHFDGSPKAASWDPNTVQFRYDAFRTVMNWAMDCAWFAKDPKQVQLSDRLVDFFARQGKVYPSNYHLDGTPTNQSSSSALVAMNATAALCATSPHARQLVEALYNQPIPTGQWRYYDGMLHTLALLHLSGNFRIYAPAQ